MVTNTEDLVAYYNKFNEEKRLDSRHGQVEYRISMYYILQCLKRLADGQTSDHEEGKIRILDIGAGTGRYSVPLSEMGYDVTAVELVKYNLGILKQKNSSVKAYQGNAMKLKRFPENSFDLTLLFGPMYHLLSHEEKLTALKEAKRVTKPGGYILVAYVMNEYSIVTYAFKERHILECQEEGRLTDAFRMQTKPGDLYDYVRIEDIDRLNEDAGLTREKILSPDGPADYIRPFLNQLSEEEFERFIQYQMAVCERRDLIGAGAHTVDILRKGDV